MLPSKRRKKKKEEDLADGFGEGFAYSRKVEEIIGNYYELIERSDDLIQSVMPDGRYFYVNRACRETLGYSREEVADLCFLDVIHPDSRSHCKAVFGELLCGKSFQHIEFDLITRNGERLSVEGDVSCSFEGGKPVATRGVFRPASAREERPEEYKAGEEGISPEELFLEFRDLVRG